MEATDWQVGQIQKLKELTCDLPEEDVLRYVDAILCNNQALVDKALQLLDHPENTVRLIRSTPSNRQFYCVRGSRSQSYICFDHYCSCRSFFEQARKTEERLLCKHLLAIVLAHGLHKVEVMEVIDPPSHSNAVDRWAQLYVEAMAEMETQGHPYHHNGTPP